jgi:hypothetical protein
MVAIGWPRGQQTVNPIEFEAGTENMPITSRSVTVNSRGIFADIVADYLEAGNTLNA